MKILRKIGLYVIIIYTVNYPTAFAQDSTNTTLQTQEVIGFLDFNGYYDTREFSVLTINMLAKLQHGFEYFSLTNFQGDKGTADLGGFYTEQNVRWNPNPKLPLNLTAQWIIRSGNRNDNVFLGFIWRPADMPALAPLFKKLHLYYFINPHLIGLSEFKSIRYLPQLEHVYRLVIFPELLQSRVYLAGFADQNITYHKSGRISFRWVTEHQLGIMLLKQFYAVAEYRVNQNIPSEQQGLGFGLEYIITY